MKSELKERWKAELNEFWTKVRKVAVFTVTGATAVWVASTTLALTLPTWVGTFCTYVIVAGTFVGLSAQLTKK